HRLANHDVGVAGPGVIDVRARNDAAGAALEVNRGAPGRHAAERPHAHDVPRDRKILRSIAEMTRHVVQHARDFRRARAQRRRRLERVIALVRIEEPQLIAEHRFVVHENVRAAGDVVDQIDIAAKVRLPREPRIVDRQRVPRQMKVVVREEIGRRRRRFGPRQRRLRIRRRAAETQEHEDEKATETQSHRAMWFCPLSLCGSMAHNAPCLRGGFPSRCAMRSSSSAICFLSAGNWRKIADAFSQSRFLMAGYPETNSPAPSEWGIPVCAVATAPWPMRRCPATPTCPASTTSSSITVLPAMPTGAASSARAPTLTPCAICTRLSIFAPA